MSRKTRQYCESGYYHIIIRGVNRQEIFHDDRDRAKYLDTLRRYATELEIDILAYCLMDNHVHLLAHAEETLSLFVKKLASSYVYYFNHKYDRVGHLFQDRYKSVAIVDDGQLLTTARYILRNPQKAGICKAEAYPWSSWREMTHGYGLCNPYLLCEVAGDMAALMAFILADDGPEPEDCGAPTDEAALRILRRFYDGEPTTLAALPIEQRNAVLVRAKQSGMTVRQISRLTGLDRNIIQRAK